MIFRAMHICPEHLATFKQQFFFFFLNQEEILANLIQSLTSEAKVLNPITYGVQGC